MRRRRMDYKKPIRLPRWLLVLITAGWWVLLIILVITVDPDRLKNVTFTGLYFPMLLIVFLAISGTLFLLRKKFWPSILWAVAVSSFLILKILGWGNFINLIVIGLCLLIWEGYWHLKSNAMAQTKQPDATETLKTD